MKLVLVAYAFVALALGAPSENINGRIAGGDVADIANYPYALQLEYMDELVCGAILVTTKFALTAAQCVVSRDTEYLLVRASATTLYEGGQEFTVAEIIYHPKYDVWSNNYGVALLVLSDEVSVSNASPIELATNDDAIVEGVNITVAGWGWQDFTYYAEFATTLQVIELPIIDDETCSSNYVFDIVSDIMFCAAYLESEGRGFCNGDNGGPAVIDGVLVGVITFGKGCGDGTNAGVLIRVSKVKDWITDIIEAADG